MEEISVILIGSNVISETLAYRGGRPLCHAPPLDPKSVKQNQAVLAQAKLACDVTRL